MSEKIKGLAKDMLKFRAQNNMSQKELAKRCKLTHQTICNVENGVQNPTQLTEAKIRLVIDGGFKND